MFLARAPRQESQPPIMGAWYAAKSLPIGRGGMYSVNLDPKGGRHGV
jgi:hypothetical protein